MIDIKLVRDNIDLVKDGLKKKGVNPADVDAVFELDKKYRDLLFIIEGDKAEQNRISNEISSISDNEERNKKINEVQSLKAQIKEKEEELEKIEQDLFKKLNALPNLPDKDALFGVGEEDNKVLRKVGSIPEFDFDILDHIQIGEKLDLLDIKQASKVSGSRFFYLKNEAVLLEFALVQFVFDTLISEGFAPILPPVMIRPKMYMNMGRLQHDQKEERYYIQNDDLYLVGSAEHTVGPFHADQILNESDLPKRYVAFSTSFRREAGSYGKDTKGILRVHQFDKVELFSFTTPNESKKEHEFLLSMQERMMQALDIPYQVVEVCTGDMGFTDAKQYDIEAWIPSQNKYRETHSCSNTTDFQARGINAKFKNKETGKNELLHMLNATGFAMTRILIAILENNQQKDGSVKIPKALQKYMGQKEKIG